MDEIDVTTHFAGRDWEFPFYINASDRWKREGERHQSTLGSSSGSVRYSFVSGSYSAALNNLTDDSYTVKSKISQNLLLLQRILDWISRIPSGQQVQSEPSSPLFCKCIVGTLMQKNCFHARRRTLFKTWRAHLKDYAGAKHSPGSVERGWLWYGIWQTIETSYDLDSNG